MKRGLMVLILALVLLCGLQAQSLKGMSLNGATGLYTIPSARIGWEARANVGLDFGFGVIFPDNRDANFIPRLAVSLFKLFEVSGAFDIQGEYDNDFLLGLKFQLPTQGSAVALGVNFQAIKTPLLGSSYDRNATQIYGAITYPGTFFRMPAETSVVIGHTFVEKTTADDKNFDFGMGFDLNLAPDVFSNLVHWVVDFANFSYSYDARGSNASARGSLNTGLRFDFASLPQLSRYKFAVDLMFLDLFDSNRTFALSAVFGIPIN
ncbi:MAG: hypothetical protein LBQ61_01910 [Spirochaetales bacterium]|nr:hypothetical protein [Spirochaetales bacterium]